MDTPSWLNKNLIESSLRKYFKDDTIRIATFSSKPAITTGENYTTYVFRINITHFRGNSPTKQNMSLIVKCMCDGIVAGLVKELNMFTKEVDMFLSVLPKMTEVYGNNVLSSDCINASLEPTPYLILQDLCELGYRVSERQKGLDLQHALQVLEKIAIFHATSYVICEKDPSILKDIYDKGIFTKANEIVAWLKLGFEMFTDMTANCKEFNKYHEKLKNITEGDFIERCLASWRRHPGEFSVINHGDSWVNNMMFCYDEEGKVKDCKYLDYQLCIHTSPAIDLHYFISTSLADDAIEDINHLLDFYYIRLLMNLNKLKCNLKEVPSLKEFKDDFRRRSFYGLTAMVGVLPIIKADSRSDAKFDALLSSEAPKDGFRYHCYYNDRFKGTLARLLPFYDELGVFS